jgi:hypothetical protein
MEVVSVSINEVVAGSITAILKLELVWNWATQPLEDSWVAA